MFLLALFSIYDVGQTKSFKIFKQEAVHETTVDQLGIANCTQNEIIDVTTKSKVMNELWIRYCIT